MPATLQNGEVNGGFDRSINQLDIAALDSTNQVEGAVGAPINDSSVEIISQCYFNPACDVVESPPGRDEVRGRSDLGDGRVPDAVFFEDADIALRITKLLWTSGPLGDSVTYTIEVNHAGYSWVILRNYQRIHALHINLYFFDASMRLKNRVQGDLKTEPINANGFFPVMPKRCPPDATVEMETEHAYVMEDYLTKMFEDHARREHVASLRFLEVSDMSFPLGPQTVERMKDSEMVVQKLSCNLHEVCLVPCNHDNAACKLFSQWKERWVVIQETCYIYRHTKTGLIAGVFLHDQHMKVEQLLTRNTSLLIKHALKDLIINFPNKFEMELWRCQMKNAMEKVAVDFTVPHERGSFVPIRNGVHARFFINGKAYMEAVADALESAVKQIFIGGWWVSPDVFLKRPITEGLRWRLDQILKRKAEAGVQIFILMYKESRAVLGINSFYTKRKLTRLHPNIHVQRHPDKNVLLWSHHEKTVIIDQKLAFVGGIDLCYGRWDDHHYRLCDVTDQMLEEGLGDAGAAVEKYGEDLNLRYARKPKLTSAIRRTGMGKRAAIKNTVAAPWRGLRAKMNVPKFRPRSRFNYKMRRAQKSCIEKIGGTFRKLFHTKSKEEKRAIHEDRMEELSMLAKECLWIGKDYVNEVKYAFSQPDCGDPYEDLLDRKKTPRLPWHDASACVWGVGARDTARHFIQKWNACKFQKFRFDEDHQFLMPGLYEGLELPAFLPDDAASCRVQVLRSTCAWSSGLLPDVVDHSIQEGYIDLIRNSKHFVYMESQFFITLIGSHKTVKNRVGEALFRRIERAFRANETFRLYIVLPLQPAIAGAYGTRAGAAVQAVTHWIYQSISQGKHSLLGNLRQIGADPSNYVTVCGLRQHGEIVGRLATEIVYVHSKLMVVDDVFTIIGSANMNDRSMLGKRDSEIAWLIEDTQFEDSVMDGRPYRSGLFSGRLRKELMKISLGLIEDLPHGVPPAEANRIVEDPVSENFYRGIWIATAVKNDAIFQEVFACVPNDRVHSFSELREFEKQKTINETDPDQARQVLQGVRGYLVKFPLKFLKDSKLLPACSTAAGLVPAINWT
ncbi:Phospholipase D1 [Hypsibius exemplaris]|uniref:Phospholipase n=1 Tax=Hypsibius exemplaris TaxID=2072580 RepID=A0A1W0WSF6_HYPEX|nr:Phospholipase D1 [Hypsibius exemplaris]